MSRDWAIVGGTLYPTKKRKERVRHKTHESRVGEVGVTFRVITLPLIINMLYAYDIEI